MKVESTTALKIKFTGNDAVNFVSAIRKISASNKTVGFKKESLNEGEEHLFKKLSDMLGGRPKPPQDQKGTVEDLSK